MKKISVGVPCYGAQEGQWWAQLVKNMVNLTKSAEIIGILVSDSMATDHNRNLIAESFLKSDAEWLMWIDADTVIPPEGIEKLLDSGKKIISGLYYAKHPPHNPIAYYDHLNAYKSLDHEGGRWEKGEILEVDSVGFGCMLTHRSVFEDIKANYVMKQEVGGGVILVHKDDIKEGIDSDFNGVIGNTRHSKLTDVQIDLRFPFFALEHGRTEDIWWCERVKRLGHKIWLDTSVECGHIYPRAFEGKDYRKMYGY
jgi:hypothetical protein